MKCSDSLYKLTSITCCNLQYLKLKNKLTYRSAAALSKRKRLYILKEIFQRAQRGILPRIESLNKLAYFYKVPLTDLISVDLKARDLLADHLKADKIKKKTELAAKITFVNPIDL